MNPKTDELRKYVLAPTDYAFREWRAKEGLPTSGKLAPRIITTGEALRGLTLRYDQIVFLPGWYARPGAADALAQLEQCVRFSGDDVPEHFGVIKALMETRAERKPEGFHKGILVGGRSAGRGSGIIIERGGSSSREGARPAGAWYDESANFARKEDRPTMCDKGLMGQCIIAYGEPHNRHRYRGNVRRVPE